MSQCIISKNTGDSYVTLLKDGPTINLPCEQAIHEHSLSKIIFWFFNERPCECSMIFRIIENPGCQACHAKK